MSKAQETPVVIIGGGLAGLTAACLLRLYDVPCILLEKHVKPSLHPRAVGFTTRTLEIFDMIGIADQVPQITSDFRLRRMKVQSLAGEWDGEMGQRHGAAQPPSTQYSPFLGAAIAQDLLEPMLRKRAEELGCDVRFGHRMLGFKIPGQIEEPVQISVRQQDSSEEYTILAKYLLAADGHRSDVREALGVPMHGRGHLRTMQSVLFNAPSLNKYLEKGFHQFVIGNPSADFQAFLTTYNDSRWVLMFQDEKDRSEEEMRKAIMVATGVPDLEYKLIATGRWELKAQVATSFSSPQGKDPRIFLLGDAAHTLPPTRGGYGANTGIGDAHNLAWKLASVLHGHSEPKLLASYDEERRPTAIFRHNQTFAGPDYADYRADGEDYGSLYDGLAVELGQVYNSAIISGEHHSVNGLLALKPDEANGTPGVRAPHFWLLKNGERVSSLAVIGKDWTLITEEPEWKPVIGTLSTELALTVQTVCPPDDNVQEETKGDISKHLGLEKGAASLVRPDGVVAWRSHTWSDAKTASRELKAALVICSCLPLTVNTT